MVNQPLKYRPGTQRRETGYSEYTDLIPQPRDCVDIAVKIAFEINEQQKEGTNIEQINENVFSQISNKKALNTVTQIIDGTFIRELQSSNKNIRRDAKQALGTMQEVLQIINKETKNSASLTTINQIHQKYNSVKEDKIFLGSKIDSKHLSKI